MMLRELRKAARYQFSREDYLREEGPTFNVLSWNMMCITPYHFYQSLASMGLVYEDDRLIFNKSTMIYVKADAGCALVCQKLAEKVRLHSESLVELWLRKTWCSLYKDS